MNRTEQLLTRACTNGVKGLAHDDPSTIEKTRLMVNARFWLDAVSGNKSRFKPDAVPMAGPAPDAPEPDLVSRSSYECGLPKGCDLSLPGLDLTDNKETMEFRFGDCKELDIPPQFAKVSVPSKRLNGDKIFSRTVECFTTVSSVVFRCTVPTIVQNNDKLQVDEISLKLSLR
jgi:hypothetical protein